MERGKSQAIEFATLARLCDALGVGAGDILGVAPTAHVAPILGGKDEDEIIAERRAEAETEIAALIADPSLAARALEGAFALPIAEQEATDRELAPAIFAAYVETITSINTMTGRGELSRVMLERLLSVLAGTPSETSHHYAALLHALREGDAPLPTERAEQAVPNIPQTRAS